MIHLDPTDPTPVDRQIVRNVRAAIADGIYQVGDPLPTVRQVAVELRVNANAVSRAYEELERLGMVEHRPGKGFYLTSPGAAHGQPVLAELVTLEDDFLRRASDLGFSLDEVIIHLDSRRTD